MNHYPPELARADRLLTAEELALKYTPPGTDERDAEHPRYSGWDWRQAVAQRVTIQGYWAWVQARTENEE